MVKKVYFRSIILVWMMLFTNVLFSQTSGKYTFDKITTEIYQLQQGISQNSVRCVFEDKQGYLWIGTWEGLNRYDGVEFKIFIPELNKPKTSLSHQAINAIAQDGNGYIWVGTEGGLNRISPNTMAIKQFDIFKNGRVINDTIRSLFVDNKNNLWVGTQRGLFIIDESRQTASTLKEYLQLKKPELEKGEIRAIMQDVNFNFWIGTENGLVYINQNYRSTQYFYNKEESLFRLSDNRITSIIIPNDSLIFVGTEQGLNILNLTKKECRHYFSSSKKDSLNNSIILSLLQENANTIWIGTSGGGISKYYLDKGIFESINPKNLNGNPKGNEIEDKYINSLTLNKQGIIWAGTAFNGLLKINERQNLFKLFQMGALNAKGLNSNNIWSFAEYKDEFWIGTENGVNIYNKKTHSFKYLKASHNGLSSNKIRCLYLDSYKTIWIGTFDGGLNHYFPETGKIVVYNSNTKSKNRISNNAIWSIVEDKYGNLWVGTYSGLNKINLTTNSISYYYNNQPDASSLSDNTVYDLFIDSKDNLWVATYNGLCKYNYSKNNFVTFKHIQGDSKSLSTNKLFDLYQDKLGNLWIGTMGGGLNKFDIKTGKVKFYTMENGLPNNVVYSILDDYLGNLWLSTNKGISQFNMFEESFINYTVNDGVQSNEFNLGAKWIDTEGNMYLGGIFGINVFKPDELFKSVQIPRMVISGFKSIELDEYYGIGKGDTITLTYSNNVFTIKYAALDFTNPSKNQYKHQLLNYDRNWIYTTSLSPSASYNRVPPGIYTFKVMGSNSDGRWVNEAFNFTIIIKPPWYDTLLFKIGTSLFIILLIAYILINRFRRLRRKHSIEKQLFELERQSLRLQMNPHFIFNTLNSIQSFVINNNQDESVRYLSKFSKLMRMMLQNSSESIVPLSNEIELLQYYLELEKLRFANKFNYTITLSPEIDSEFCGIPPALMQPYIENAIIHGVQHRNDNLGLIQISFSLKSQDILICEIEDNGKGREYSAKVKAATGTSHNSKGMLITKERLELLNQNLENQLDVEVIDLFDKDRSAIGTKIKIFINFQEL